MAGGSIDIKIDDTQVRTALQNLRAAISNMRPAMAEIGEIVTESIQRNFEEHRSPDDNSWQAVTPEYAEWKSKKGKNPSDILIFNNILMRSIHPKPENDKVTIGTNIVYAAIHQFGGSTNRGGQIPARPFLGVRDGDWPKIQAAIECYLLKKAS